LGRCDTNFARFAMLYQIAILTTKVRTLKQEFTHWGALVTL